jgi:hypothetical protein
MADYWIKLYHEILDDPKMATMSDHLWRRTIELFMAAGRINKEGSLPSTKEVAWMLRTTEQDLAPDLEKIAANGIITKTDSGWFINKFSIRQAAVPDAERQRQHRERSHKAQYYGDDVVTDNVTSLSRNVTQIRSDQIRTDNPPQVYSESQKGTNLLDSELHYFLEGCKKTRESLTKLDFTDEFRYALRNILTAAQGGSQKWLRACENLARAPDDVRYVKSVLWLLEKKQQAINRVVQMAALSNGNGADKTRGPRIEPPPGWSLTGNASKAIAE